MHFPISSPADRWLRYGLLVLALVAAVLPFWTTALPPATDLPQHLGQMYLLDQTLAGARPDLVVTPWFYPNTLIYAPLYAFWKLFDPIDAGRLMMSALAVAWLCATWLLCATYRRPVENWLLGAPLVFNFLFNWGLLNFLIGWPLFCLLMVVVAGPVSRRRSLLLLLVGLLLYYAHALWFVMANAWIALQMLQRHGRDRWALGWPMLPAWLLALVWYPQLAAKRKGSGVETGMIWDTLPQQRLDSSYLVDSMLGSIHADVELAFCTLVLMWLLVIVVTRWRELRQTTDRPLFCAALMLLVAFSILPDIYMNTIFFNRRWLPCGLALLLLALPAPRLPRLYALTIGAGFLLTFTLVTVKQWWEWEAEQLEGLFDAIALVEKGDSLMGLNLYDGSAFVKGRPGLHLTVYAQVLRGAEPHFSFTEHYSGVVQFRKPPPPNPNVSWSGFRRTPAQVRSFEKVLVNGDERIHAYARQRWNLIQIGATQTSWRLYRNSP